MKKILSLLVIVLIITSCKKTNSNSNACDRIIDVLEYEPYGLVRYDTTAVLTYDQQGRIKTVIGGGQNTTYNYFDTTVYIQSTDLYGNDISVVYDLDKMHRIIGSYGNDSDFQYNADGYLVFYKQYYGNAGVTTGFTPYYLDYSNGDLIKLYTTAPSVSKQQVTFEYYNKPNQDMLGYNSTLYLANVIYDRNTFYLIGEGYFGKQSKDLLKTLNFNNINYEDSTIYDFDVKGRINGIEQAYSFTYQCP